MGKRIIPSKNQPAADLVMTPPELARRCVQVLAPTGFVLYPCAGDGAFVDALRDIGAEPGWFEIDELRSHYNPGGGSFLNARFCAPLPWIITNPPYSKYLQFAEKSFEVADNVAFLAPIERAIRLSVERRATATRHAVRAVWKTPWPEIWSRAKSRGGYGATKPDAAFGLVWWQRGYSGPQLWEHLPELQVLEEVGAV